jgi:N-acetylmuramic acid 6-phosphate etherase
MRAANDKLRDRAARVCMAAAGCDQDAARAALSAAGDDVSLAVVMLARGSTRNGAASCWSAPGEP